MVYALDLRRNKEEVSSCFGDTDGKEFLREVLCTDFFDGNFREKDGEKIPIARMMIAIAMSWNVVSDSPRIAKPSA